jgi:uncharacterized spore protein YtfJ
MQSAEEILAAAREAMTVRRVFGDPIERDGVIVVPVASVMGGGGAGSGRAPMPASTGADDAAGVAAVDDEPGSSGGAAAGEGSGAGFGLVARPAGTYVIRGDDVEWVPAIDRNRQILVMGLVASLGILAVRSVLLALLRR